MRVGVPALLMLALAFASAPSDAEPKKKKRRSPRPVAASRAWHAVKPGAAAPPDASGRPMLVLQALNVPDRLEIAARSDRGGFRAEDLVRAAHVLREAWSGNEHPVDPRVLDLVYRVQVHFSAPEIRVISGYRTPKKTSHGNHGRGRAIDLVVPGAKDNDVAVFARAQGFVGVGVYPVSGFLHLDVRPRSYFWVDTSGPGRRSRTRGILAGVAAKSDALALARGERPVDPFAIGTDVDAALAEDAFLAAPGPEGGTTEEEDADMIQDEEP